MVGLNALPPIRRKRKEALVSMPMPDYTPAPTPKKKMSAGKKAVLVGGGVLAGLVIIGVAAGGHDETLTGAPVAAATTAPTGTPNQEAIGKLQACIEMAAGVRAYDPALWDTTVCGEYQGGLAPTSQPSIEATEATEAVAEPASEPTKELTDSQQNAVEKAADYLSYSSFSRSGLIKQLKFEGFSTKQATFGVDAQKANWNEQAAKKAGEYLENGSFSRSGLIEQLKFEGFTTGQATYGVKKAGL
jgi:hypothetical protein